jgi:hypothetical protein
MGEIRQKDRRKERRKRKCMVEDSRGGKDHGERKEGDQGEGRHILNLFSRENVWLCRLEVGLNGKKGASSPPPPVPSSPR